MNEWTFQWNDIELLDALGLAAYTVETWPLVTAVAGVKGPFADADDFRRRALTWTDRRVRVYTSRPNGVPQIVVPEDYACALDGIRRLRSVLEGLDTDDAPSGTLLEPALLSRALPEDIYALLGNGAPSHVAQTILLLNEHNPADAWHRQSSANNAFVSAASADNGVITLYCAERSTMLREQLSHELAHLYGQQYEIEWHWFTIAAQLEADGFMHRDRAALSVAENWAVHLGECVFGEDGERFANFCRHAPVRGAVLGRVLLRLVEPGSDQWNDPVALRRAVHLCGEVRREAMARVRVGIDAGAHGDDAETRALHLLLALADGEPLAGFEMRIRVDLSGAPFTSKVLRTLVTFAALETLDLSGTLIGRGGLSTLPALTRLRRLDLHGTRIWSSDVRNIGALKDLEWLDMGGTNINDSCLPDILRMSSLRYLGVACTPLADTTSKLRELLPHCEIAL